MSVRTIANYLSIAKIPCTRYRSQNLHMQKMCTKLFPKSLTDDHKNNWDMMKRELLECDQNKLDFLASVITDCET